MQLQGVASLPGRVTGSSDGLVELVALAQPAALLSRRGQAAHLSVLVHGLGDPLGVRVAPDCLMEGVYQNHLKELVGGVLAHPVRVQHPQAAAVTAGAALQQTEKAGPVSTRLPKNIYTSSANRDGPFATGAIILPRSSSDLCEMFNNCIILGR